MEALGRWVLLTEYHLAKPVSSTQLRQVAPLLLAVSWVVFVHALQRHIKLTLRGWALPGVQAGCFQLLITIIASAVPPTLAVTAGWASGRGRAWGLFFQGLALLISSVSLPRRVVRLCVPPREQPRPSPPKAGIEAMVFRFRCGLLAAGFFLLLRPVNVAAEFMVGLAGHRAELPEVVLDALLLICGLIAAWLGGRDTRHTVLGPRVPAYSSVYHVVVANSIAWLLTSIMTLCVDGRRENAVLAEMLKVVETAFAAAWVAGLFEPTHDPLVQMALTQSRPQSESETDDLCGQGVKGLKGILRALGLIFNLWQPIWEAIDEPQPQVGWQAAYHEAIGSEVEPSDGPASGVDEEAELQMYGREVVRGRNAWRGWAGTSGIHPLWPGQQDKGKGPEIVDPPDLTAGEEHLKGSGVAMERRTTWPFVLLDLYSNRVRSKPLAVVVVVTLAVKAIESDMATYIANTFTNPMTCLAIQVGCLAFLWLFCGLALVGNNPYVHSRVAPVWVGCLALVLLVLSYNRAFEFFEAPRGQDHDDSFSVVEVQRRVDDLSLAFLALAGLFMAARVAVQRSGRDDFHRSEMQALWYAADLLRPHGAVTDLRSKPLEEGEKLRLGPKSEDGPEAVVERAPGDGTCDLQLCDGREFKGVLYKSVRRETPETVVAEESKDKQLDRLKQVLSAAEEYPAALYFGAAASMPILVHLACGVLQVVKAFVHKVYQAHVVAAVINFYIWGQVVGAPGNMTLSGPVAMAAQVEAWRLQGGTGLATPDTLAERGIPELYYRWGDGGPQDDRYPCAENKLGGKVLALIAYGRTSVDSPGVVQHVYWDDMARGVNTFGRFWGLPEKRVKELEGTLGELWRSLAAGDANFALDTTGMNTLICEAGLLLARPAAAVPEIVPIASGLARDLVGGLRDKLVVGRMELDNATKEVGQPVVRKVIRSAGLDLLGELETALDNVTTTLKNKPEDPWSAFKDAGKSFEQYSKDRAKDVAMNLAKEEAKQLGILAAEQLAAAAKGKVKEATKAGEAKLREKAHDLVADRLEQLDVASRERLGNFTTNFIEREVRRYKRAAQAKLERELAKMLDRHMGEIRRDLEAQLPDSAKAIADTLDLDLRQDRRLGKTDDEAEDVQQLEDEAKPKDGEQPEGQAAAEDDEQPQGQAGAPADAKSDGTSIASMLQTVKDTASPFVNLFLTVVNILQQDWIAWALIGIKFGVRISLICAIGCELYVMARVFRKYRTLFESMQTGKHDYVGNTDRASLAEGFAETTIFPGVFLGTSVIGFALVAIVTFIAIVVLVLLLLPMCAMTWLAPYWPLVKYILLAVALKKFLQMVLLDWLLVDGGDIVFPAVFSLLWFIQLFLNFVIGLSTAVARAVVVVFVAALSCCFVDFTLLPEPLVSLDTAYYSLLAMAYTHHERRNPIKMAAVTVLNGWVHRVHAPKHQAAIELESTVSQRDEGEQPAVASQPSKALLRVRSRFNLYLTLHRNPEVRKFRRPEVQVESKPSFTDILRGGGSIRSRA